ncbi:unnamed protein product [Gongylonema pulchrum]|uniref:CMP/dCMP-type deaminase domain-containing protein n=1 Tax=Gongylonema pulchrum TaxID=637853 RepID=A0A183EGA1_9BILA|nr:unnamed protein product [Gongylonema pulchrum]
MTEKTAWWKMPLALSSEQRNKRACWQINGFQGDLALFSSAWTPCMLCSNSLHHHFCEKPFFDKIVQVNVKRDGRRLRTQGNGVTGAMPSIELLLTAA